MVAFSNLPQSGSQCLMWIASSLPSDIVGRDRACPVSLESIRITLNSVNTPGFPNPPLGCAFAAPFGKGGRQTRSDWRGDFYPRRHPCEVIRTGTKPDFKKSVH